jgi:predicted DNA-binding transcriptional regulator AlpA
MMLPSTPPVPRLLGAPLAAAYLGISERTLERLWRSERLPAPHRIGARLLWDRLLLDQYVDALSDIASAMPSASPVPSVRPRKAPLDW